MIKCPICDTEIIKENFIKTYFSHHVKQEYKLYHCPECHLEFWMPMKIIPEFYEDECFSEYSSVHNVDRLRRELPHWSRPFFKWFRLKSGRLLDVGCADGVFLENVKKSGFDIYGIDLDKKSIQVAKKRGIEHAYAMFLKDFVKFAEERNLKFDIITFFEVLDHQDNPVEFIRDIKKIIKVNGYISGSLANRERFLVNLSRKFNEGDFPPHHFTYWSKEVLRFFLDKDGFENIEVNTHGQFSLGYVSNWWASRLFGYVALLKERLKPYVVKDERFSSLGVETLESISGNNNLLLKIFKRIIRMIFIMPLALLTVSLFKRSGDAIYFQAKLKDQPENQKI